MNIRLVATIVIFLLLAGLCVMEEVVVNGSFDELEKRLEAVKNPSRLSLEEMLDIEEWWQDEHKTLETILPHVNLNEITFVLGELVGAIEAEDYKSAEAQYYRLIRVVEAVPEMYTVSISNVF